MSMATKPAIGRALAILTICALARRRSPVTSTAPRFNAVSAVQSIATVKLRVQGAIFSAEFDLAVT
jgi:hypothetical protein